MFSLIQKVLNLVQSSDALSKRLDALETKLERFEKLADENEALWQFLDDQKENDKIFVGSPEEFEEEFTDIMVRAMKPRGDA